MPTRDAKGHETKRPCAIKTTSEVVCFGDKVLVKSISFCFMKEGGHNTLRDTFWADVHGVTEEEILIGCFRFLSCYRRAGIWIKLVLYLSNLKFFTGNRFQISVIVRRA